MDALSRPRLTRWLLASLVLIAPAQSCNSPEQGLGTEATASQDEPTDEQDTETSVGTSDAVADSGMRARCETPRFEESPDAIAFGGLSGIVVDEQGEAISGLLAQACGLNVCLQQQTDAQGRVAITSDELISKAAFKYGDGLRYAQLALLLQGSDEHELGSQYTIAFPALETSEPLLAGQSATSSGATLRLAESASVEFDLLSFPDDTEHVFVASQFAQATLPQAAESEQFDAVWAFGPLKTRFCPPAELSLPNSTGLEPRTRVEMHLHVTDIAGHWGRYGEWGKVAQATVSQDGLYIVTDPDQGLPELGVVGLRAVGAAREQ